VGESREIADNVQPVSGTLFCIWHLSLNMNWDSEKDMARDVEENRELYEALTDKNNKPKSELD